VDGWWRQEGHVLHAADLDEVLEAKPELLVVGQGANGRMRVAKDAKQALQEGGIEFTASPTPQAVERFNAAPENQAVAAAFHLTC
jgi:hypothetical protein